MKKTKQMSVTALRFDIYNVIKELNETGEIEITHKGEIVAKLVEVK